MKTITFRRNPVIGLIILFIGTFVLSSIGGNIANAIQSEIEWTEHTIVYSPTWAPKGIYAADIDKDGNIDVLSANSNWASIAYVAWYENSGGWPLSWTEHIIATLPGGCALSDIFAADLDNDDDVDVLTAAFHVGPCDHCLVWYENRGGSPPSWTTRVIPVPGTRTPDIMPNSKTMLVGPSVFAVDINDDDRTDILWGDVDGVGEPMVLAWYENLGGSPPSWYQRLIPCSFMTPSQVDLFGIDIDSNNDIDILVGIRGAYQDQGVAWYENLGGSPPSWAEHIIKEAGTSTVFAADLDNDDDVDVLADGSWYENLGGSPPSWNEHYIGNIDYDIFAIDIDNDNDIDVFGSRSVGGSDRERIYWYENDGGSPPSWTEHSVGRGFLVFPIDIDNDDDIDVAAGWEEDLWWPGRVLWHEQFAENQPPTVEITSPSDGENVGSEVLIIGTAEDSDGTIDHVEVKIDDGAWSTATGTINWSYEWDATGVDPGVHTISARSFDDLGVASTIKSVEVYADNAEYTRQDIVQAIQELGAVVDSQIIQSTWYLACQHAYLLKDIYEKPDVKDDYVNALGKAASAAELAINLIDLNPGSIIMSVAAEYVLAEALNRFHDENIAACKAFVDHIYGPEGLNPNDPIPTLQEQMFELLKTYQEGPYVLQVLAGLDILFWYATGSIPDPLPPDYPTREVVSYIRDIKGDFDYRNRGRSWIMKWFSPEGYDAADPSDDEICLYQKMGAIKDYYENSKLIYEDAFPQEEKNYEMIGTGQKWSIGAGGVVALLGVVVCFIPGGQLVGAAMIVGGLAVPSTIYLVGTVAQKTVDLNYDRVLASWGVTSFEQLYEEMHNSFTLADNLDEYVQDPIVFSPNSIDIIDAYVPDIFLGEDENVGKATGWIDVKNVGNQAGKVNFFGDIRLENKGSVLCASVTGAQEIVELLPGQTQQINFEFWAPDVVDMFKVSEKYNIQMYVSIGPAVTSTSIFPELAEKLRFYVGPPEYYPEGKDQTVIPLIADKILEGDTVTTSFMTDGTTRRIEFLLDYVRGELNLHIYDELGNHVGYNSSIEEDETNIPNSLYSGSSSFPELVTIYQSSAQEYTVKVVGVNTQGFERFLVTAIETPERPAMINATPTNPQLVAQPGDTLDRLLVISEINGQHDAEGIQITATDLVCESYVISSSNICFDLPSTIVPAGSLLTVPMIISVPGEAQSGIYSGSIYINSTTGGTDEISLTLIVNTAPFEPVIPSGPTLVYDHFPYSYSTTATDPENDSIYYTFAWSDENGSDWYGPFGSRDSCAASHAWAEPDTYYVKVRAMDVWSYMSDWSDSLAVTVAFVERGDANGDGVIELGDVVYLINYLFKSGPAPYPVVAGDANCDGVVDLGDVVYLINYLFKGGPPPGC